MADSERVERGLGTPARGAAKGSRLALSGGNFRRHRRGRTGAVLIDRGPGSAPVNKGDLVDAVARELGVTKGEAARVVEGVFTCLAAGLAQHKKVTIAGFGTFNARIRAARNGVHPITRQPMQIAEAKTCSFKAAPALKDSL